MAKSSSFHWLPLGVILCSLLANTQVPDANRFDAVASHYASAGFINGTVLIAQHGKTIYARGFGEADMTAHTPNTPRTKFEIASLTKQFTAALVLQQASEGRIQLEAPVSEYLPWYRSDIGRRITIEQLLHHSSGLPADYDAPAFNATPIAATHYDPQPFVERFCQTDLTAVPGTKWQYSNCGYDILGLVLERVTGNSFEQLLKTRILDPAGMRETGLDRNDLELANRARGYERHFGPAYVPGPYIDLTHVYSAGGMYSTAEDLLRWNEVLSSDALFPKSVRDQVFHPGLGDWGYGWFITTIPPGQPGAGSILEEMRGDLPGNFFTSIARFPDQDAVIIVLRNGYGSSERLEANLQAVLFNREPHFPWRKPADLAVRAFRAIANPIHFHPIFAVIVLILTLLLFSHRRIRNHVIVRS